MATGEHYLTTSIDSKNKISPPAHFPIHLPGWRRVSLIKLIAYLFLVYFNSLAEYFCHELWKIRICHQQIVSHLKTSHLINHSKSSDRSVILIKNYRRLRIDSWGTPAIAVIRSLSIEYHNTRFRSLPDILFSCSLKVIPLCHTTCLISLIPCILLFKNFEALIFLAFVFYDHKLIAQHNSFALSHGKITYDGIGGTFYRVAVDTSSCFSHPYNLN